MDFILVSNDMKEIAKANAGSFANPHKMVVLIDEEKIERMASDEQYRKQYEGVIASAQNKLPELKQSLGNSANSIEELKKKIDDYNYLQMADTVKTDAEKYLGTTIDFKG